MTTQSDLSNYFSIQDRINELELENKRLQRQVEKLQAKKVYVVKSRKIKPSKLDLIKLMVKKGFNNKDIERLTDAKPNYIKHTRSRVNSGAIT